MKYRALSNSYLSMFCMELYTLLQAGITVTDGVLMLQDDEKEKDGRTVLQSLVGTLEDGEPLSEAFRRSGYFPHYTISMVEIGEKTGRLTETLKALSAHYDRQDRLTVSIKNAVLYPAMLLVMMVAVVLILIVRVLPIFNDVFNRLGTQMSPVAERLMQFGRWLGDASAVIAAVLGAAILAALVFWMVPAVRRRVVAVCKNKWGSAGVFGEIASSRFVSAMALALASGLDMEAAVESAASVSGGARVVDETHERCLDLLRGSCSLADAMRDAGILSARYGRMLAVGGRSGATDVIMAEIAQRLDRDVQDRINRIVGRIEPVLVIVTSVLVGIILLSVMLPLMSIMTAIG